MKGYTVRGRNVDWWLDVFFMDGTEGKSYHPCAALEELATQEPGCWSQCWSQRRCNFLHPTDRLWLCRGDRSLETQIDDCPLVQMMDTHWRSKQMTDLIGNKSETNKFGRVFHFFFLQRPIYYCIFNIVLYIMLRYVTNNTREPMRERNKFKGTRNKPNQRNTKPTIFSPQPYLLQQKTKVKGIRSVLWKGDFFFFPGLICMERVGDSKNWDQTLLKWQHYSFSSYLTTQLDT